MKVSQKDVLLYKKKFTEHFARCVKNKSTIEPLKFSNFVVLCKKIERNIANGSY